MRLFAEPDRLHAVIAVAPGDTHFTPIFGETTPRSPQERGKLTRWQSGHGLGILGPEGTMSFENS
jgi:hypothetical protein